MISNITKIIIFVGAAVVLYLYNIGIFSKTKKVKNDNMTRIPAEHSPNEKDVVLAHLSTGEHAILWNGKPDVKYYYEILDEDANIIVAHGESSSKGGVIKIKNIPISAKQRYRVTIGDTSISIIFDPPEVLEINSIFTKNSTSLRTTYMPTDVEVLVDGKKLPYENMGILGDPEPGVNISHDECDELIVMVYNGPNVAHIFTKNMSL